MFVSCVLRNTTDALMFSTLGGLEVCCSTSTTWHWHLDTIYFVLADGPVESIIHTGACELLSFVEGTGKLGSLALRTRWMLQESISRIWELGC